MNRLLSSGLVLGAALTAVLFLFVADRPAYCQEVLGKTSEAWTLDEARRQLVLNPSDPYLQYVALQLAEGEKETKEVARMIEGFTNPGGRRPDRRADLFALFTGAAAVQESLQLDAMQRLRDQWQQFTQLHQQAIGEPTNAETRFQLGLLARELDKRELAVDWFAAAVGLDPQHAAARQALQEMANPTGASPPSDADN